MFDVFYIGPKPNLFAHEREVSSVEQAQAESCTRYCWIVNYLSDYTNFDFLWEPVPWQREFTHVWPSQWHEYSGTYLVPKTGAFNYHFHKQAIPNHSDQRRYKLLVDDIDFDYSWAPHPLDPPYIYVFGNQWHRAEIMPTLEYTVPGATERKYMHEPRATLRERHDNRWHTLEHCTFDYSWRPDPGDPPYIYVFGNQWHMAEIMPTVEYHVPGATERKFMGWPRAQLVEDTTRWTVPSGIDLDTVDRTWCPDPGSPPYIYQFGTQWQRTGGPTYTVPGATEVKYTNAFRVTKTSRDDCWHVPEGADVESFDWTWHPDATDPPYIYQFGTQHQRTGGPQYHVSGATETKFVDQIKIVTRRVATAVYEIDHLDGNAGQIPNTTKTSRYFDNYLDTLKRIAKTVPDEHEFIWICSSVCDYTDFDFSWHPEQWQATMLHVFPSDGEKFGDTFFMHVPSFKYRSEKCQLLEWYDLNFTDKNVPRRPLPTIKHNHDTHVDAIKTQSWAGPLAVFTTQTITVDVPCVPLWREKTKTIVPLNDDASIVIVPKNAVPYVKTQAYDYPYINKNHKRNCPTPQQDIVFISYDEPDADDNWHILREKFPRAKRIHGISGMELALEEAANVSKTPWYYAVFAKTKLYESFDFTFSPDYLQQPKHYIFNSRNSVNGLEYGHMGIVLYNCNGIRLLNAQKNFGIDYTLSFPHESVPILSCYGNFDQSPYHTWRTAFRESAKLAYFEHLNPTVEGAYRLNVWLTVAQGAHAKWALCGAEDGVEFFQSTQGQLEILKQSFRWDWLRNYFLTRYGELE